MRCKVLDKIFDNINYFGGALLTKANDQSRIIDDFVKKGWGKIESFSKNTPKTLVGANAQEFGDQAAAADQALLTTESARSPSASFNADKSAVRAQDLPPEVANPKSPKSGGRQ